MGNGLKVILTQGGRDYDLSEKNSPGRYSSVSWSGSRGQIARRATVELLDPGGEGIPCQPGSLLRISLDGRALFFGYVVQRQRTSGGKIAALECLDRGWQLSGNAGWYSFDCTPEAAAKTVCADFHVPVGSLASTEVKVNRKFPGVALHRILYTMYSRAAEITGKRYHIGFDGGGRLQVTATAETAAGVTVAPKRNLSIASYAEDISSICTAVAIYGEEGELIRMVEDSEARNLYGLFQHVVLQREGEDALPEARTWLGDHGEQRTATVNCLGDPRLVTGSAVTLAAQQSGAVGRFWIESDQHTWENGVYRCALTLNARHVMHTDSAGEEG